MSDVCVFVDGENFRHSITGVFSEEEFNPSDYLPSEARWAEFFDWLVTKACGEQSRRLRTYWYTLEYVDFFPYKIPRIDTEPDSLKLLLCKDRDTERRLKDLDGQVLLDEMDRISETLKSREQNFRSRFRGWQTVQDGIANRHRAIEFRRAGSTRYNLFTKRMGLEKAVDVRLATDLLMLRGIYDVAILVSGDQDYVPAVQVVKDAGKTVVNVAFNTQDGRLLPGGARRLNIITDDSIAVPYHEFHEFLGL